MSTLSDPNEGLRTNIDGVAPLRASTLFAPAAKIDRYMARWLDGRSMPENLRSAIRYALLSPGKRLRPILTIRACEAMGAAAEAALPAAAAVEMIHAFSLIHDDLPALDDDDLRRGRPTLHRHTSEALAILAGDMLMGLAFEIVADRVQPAILAHRLTEELVRGCNSMIVGQVHDTLPDFEESVAPLERLETIHRHKTGALIRSSCRLGAICGGTDDDRLASITKYGETIGLMFQVVDDVLDATQSTEHLGKTAGKDARQQKLTWPAVAGLEASRREITRLRERAQTALDGLGPGAAPLRDLCDYLAVRTR